MRRGLALIWLLAGCPDDALFKLGQDSGVVDPRTRVDSGRATSADASAPDAVAEDAGRKLVWVRAPSKGAALSSPEHKLRVRLAPPTSHGAQGGAEHDVNSALAGRARGEHR